MNMMQLCFKLQIEMFQCYRKSDDYTYAVLVHAQNSKSLQFSAFHVRFCFVELPILTNTVNSRSSLKR